VHPNPQLLVKGEDAIAKKWNAKHKTSYTLRNIQDAIHEIKRRVRRTLRGNIDNTNPDLGKDLRSMGWWWFRSAKPTQTDESQSIFTIDRGEPI